MKPSATVSYTHLDFTLYKNGQEAGNIFYTNYGTYDASAVPRKTELRVINTVFLIMCYSDDGGYTWSDPKLMNYGSVSYTHLQTYSPGEPPT